MCELIESLYLIPTRRLLINNIISWKNTYENNLNSEILQTRFLKKSLVSTIELSQMRHIVAG